MPAAQQYDPRNPTPYTPVQAPEIAPPSPSPISNDPVQANGAVRKSGAIATIADGMLRGFMQGKATADAKRVMQLKAKSDNLLASYNQDAERLVNLTQAGVDQNSQAYKTAQAAVQGSWGAWMDWMGTHVQQDKKGKGGKQQQQGSILDRLHGSDPMSVSAAWYQVAKQAGPPVMSQVAALSTPEAKASRQAQTRAAQNAVTATGQQATEQQHTAVVQQAQATIDQLQQTPHNQWTDAQRNQYEQAYQIVNQPKPGDEAQIAADEVVSRMRADPNYKLTQNDRQVMLAAGIKVDPGRPWKISDRGEIVQEDEKGIPQVLRGPQKAYENKAELYGPGEGRGSGSSADKAYDKWNAYYKEHYPNLDEAERKALVERKVEGASQHAEGQIQSDAIAEPRKFDNEVLTAALGKVQTMPEYKNVTNFDDIVANIIGQDQEGYAYNTRAPQARKDGDYSGNPKQQKVDLQKLDRDLQEQIRAVLNDPRNGLSQNEKRAAMARMRPLFGPAARPAGSGTPPNTPSAQAAPPPAPASSPAPQGGQNPNDPMGILH